MGKFIDLTGKVFNRWLVIEDTLEKDAKGMKLWLCRCDCGTIKKLTGYPISSGKSKSCGCLQRESATTHGMSKSTTYSSWLGCIGRCYESRNASYPRYGGAGVTVCDRWSKSFENFLEDMGERPTGCTLNRVGGAKVYSKETCEWATIGFQNFEQKLRLVNKTGVTGVCWATANGKYKATIKVGGKTMYLGYFVSLEDAAKVRYAAELEYYGFTLNDRRGY